MDLANVINQPIVTEKATHWLEETKYTFQVAREATKKEIKKAVEKYFKVKVKSIQTIMARGKKRSVGVGRRQIRTSDWKKALVQLAEGEKIDIFAAPEKKEAKK